MWWCVERFGRSVSVFRPACSADCLSVRRRVSRPSAQSQSHSSNCWCVDDLRQVADPAAWSGLARAGKGAGASPDVTQRMTAVCVSCDARTAVARGSAQRLPPSPPVPAQHATHVGAPRPARGSWGRSRGPRADRRTPAGKQRSAQRRVAWSARARRGISSRKDGRQCWRRRAPNPHCWGASKRASELSLRTGAWAWARSRA